ncbi:uncharacterized protein CTHT_0057560 [Thermochaetoides thermophila DSM 1495]|uniref:Uncharacterized protein n=1 Tax=Chaetomium thermophilum (strain DSM 1495 / CBS 144.50 / IMI 039719) TaxID=759272 RepID=G0SCK5_CHATD|nr:hypothetical protein CTHT_0057560 [Thermochaetoides thermophila DSM 1495]EGS19131.1 hypothetical protein CTHT_0057560 [Thermochaetoides thermophila DSM 1495]
MGRPRKHRPVDANSGASPPEPASKPALPSIPAPASAPELGSTQEPGQANPNDLSVAAPVMVPDFKFDSTIGMDLDVTFLNVSDPDVNFLYLMDPSSQVLPSFQGFSDLIMENTHNQQTKQLRRRPPGGPFWAMSTHLDEISFDPPSNPAMSVPAPEFTPEEATQLLTVDLPLSTPALSTTSSSSSLSAEPSPIANQRQQQQVPSPQPCSCLASLCDALHALQSLPNNATSAIRVARSAAKIAHDVIHCLACGDPPLDTSSLRLPIHALQSMMMLGALLPSLSNAYMRILEMVDAEAAAADAERRQLVFSLNGYGGLWGWLAKEGMARCEGGIERLGGAPMEPKLWRLAVRALLKVDVYGISESDLPGNSVSAGREGNRGGLSALQPGLKDIINMMEERQRRRHQRMDELVAKGVVSDAVKQCYIPLNSAFEKPTCLKIIDIAKKSIEELVIP